MDLMIKKIRSCMQLVDMKTKCDVPIISINTKYVELEDAYSFIESMKNAIENGGYEIALENDYGLNGYYFIKKDGVNLYGIYWDENDTWKYGIRNKQQAYEIAEYIVELLRMDELPTPSKRPFIVKECSRTSIYQGTCCIAQFNCEDDAEWYMQNIVSCDLRLNDRGMKSKSSRWINSILIWHDADISKICGLVADYIDEKWCR